MTGPTEDAVERQVRANGGEPIGCANLTPP
jgi:hypothetical protein